MVVLITGISSGFGAATADLLSRRGHCVYGTVRKDADCGRIPSVHYLKADVRDKASIEAAVEEIISEQGRIDALVNNAGIGIGGPIEFAEDDEIRAITETNFYGYVNCTRAVLPYMRRQRGGRIVMLSSIGGLMGLPFQAFYSAGKYAIEGFSEALRLETRSFGISVTLINPGDCATGFTAGRKKCIASAEVAAAYPGYAASMESIEHDEMHGLGPETVAKAVAKVLECRRPPYHRIVASPVQKLSVYLKKLLPAGLFASILAKYYKL